MSYFGKKYTLYKHDNFDNFLKFAGMPADKVQDLAAFPETFTLSKSGDSYTQSVTHGMGSKESTFKSGEEFAEVRGPVTIKSKVVIDGNTVTETNSSDGSSEVTFKKDFNGDELVVTVTAQGWDGVAKKFYKA